MGAGKVFPHILFCTFATHVVGIIETNILFNFPPNYHYSMAQGDMEWDDYDQVINQWASYW